MVAIGPPQEFLRQQGFLSQGGLQFGSENTVNWPPRLV